MSAGGLRRMIRAVAAALVAGGLLLPAVLAPAALALDPPPERVEGQRVYDDGLLGSEMRATAEQLTDLMAQLHDVDVIVVARQRGGTVDEPDAEATQAAVDVIDAWDLRRAVVLVVEAPFNGCNAGIGIAVAEPLPGVRLEPGEVITDDVRAAVEACQPAAATIETLGGIVTTLSAIGTNGGDGKVPAGPPFPDPAFNQAVYDYAGVFRPETIASAESTIDAIEARTGAEVVVYSQVVDSGITGPDAESHAQALMDQWGVGRKGIDDGLVILFDLDPSLKHGQVVLYGGPGYRAAYLDNSEKQRVIDEDMIPLLQQGDMDGALSIALDRVDANATVEHARSLEFARQVNAVVGLLGAPIVALVLVGSGVFAWLRYGRDPVYLDDPSIHMAGPPRDLTPAGGAFVLAGGPSRRALTTAMLDLASRGEISFRQDQGFLGLKKKVGVDVAPPATDANEEARRQLNGVRPLGSAERGALDDLAKLADATNYIEPDELLKFGESVSDFDTKLEAEVIRNGWFREPPSKATLRWGIRGGIAVGVGVVAVIIGLNLPASGLTLLGGGFIVGGIVLLVMARWMPAVSMPGAMIRAMLAAYRRTLEKTMAQSRSMDQVVAEAGLDWLTTPDQAVVWGTALGLEEDIEHVLERSVEDVRAGRSVASATYFPVWYGGGWSGAAAGAGGGGLFSSSGIPDIGGMMATLGTIGNSPSGGSGGGFGGGGSGGGGGGSSGGF